MAEGTLIDQARRAYHALWDTNAKGLSQTRTTLLRAVQIAVAVVRDVTDGQITLRAMSLVYTTLLSMAPLLALSFSVLKAMGAHNSVKPMLLNFLAPMGDNGVEVAENVILFVENIKVGVLGSVGLGLLIYTVISLVQKIEASFNFIWHIQRTRSYAERFRDYLSVIVIGPVLVVSALGITASMMSSSVVQAAADIVPFGADLLLLITRMIPYVMIIAAFTFVYMFIPNTRVNFVPAMIGGVVSGILWQTIGLLFGSFAVTSAQYDAIYSSFAIMILLLIWLYLCWLILLIGSDISYYIQHPTRTHIVRGTFVLNNRDKEHLALLMMLEIVRTHVRSERPWSADELTRRCQVTGEAVDYVLELLCNEKLIAPTAEEPKRFLPARDTANIGLDEFLLCLRRSERRLGGLREQEDDMQQLAYRLAEEFDTALSTQSGKRSLRDLVA